MKLGEQMMEVPAAKISMDITQFGNLAPQVIINMLFGGVVVWLFTKYLPQRDKAHQERIQEVIDNFLSALSAERELHKSIQAQSFAELKSLRKQFTNLTTAYIATQASLPKQANEIYEQIIKNGE